MEMVPSGADIIKWEGYNEDISALGDGSPITAIGLLDQLNMTRDSTDYLWYRTR